MVIETRKIDVEDILGEARERADVQEALRIVPFLKSVSSKLRELRSKKGMNQKQVAEKLGVHQSRISQIESGRITHTPSFEMAARFADAVGEPLALATEEEISRAVELMKSLEQENTALRNDLKKTNEELEKIRAHRVWDTVENAGAVRAKFLKVIRISGKDLDEAYERHSNIVDELPSILWSSYWGRPTGREAVSYKRQKR